MAIPRVAGGVALGLLLFCALLQNSEARTITDALGRQVEVPDKVDRVLCSGPGCLRLLVYLQGQDLLVGVDSVEKQYTQPETRPYAISNPQLQQLPLIGELRGQDNPELIASLSPRPQVIFKTFPTMGHDPQALNDKTGIPVLALNYGNLTGGRADLERTLLLMGEIINKEERARAVVEFFNARQTDLLARVENEASRDTKTCYIGGLSMRGGHGLQSTDPSYAPFAFVAAVNVAETASTQDSALTHASVSREQILAWDPEYLFLDVSTTLLEGPASGLYDLQNNPIYKGLSAVQSRRVFGVLSCNSYAQNYGSVLANAYFVGKILYPDRFQDVDPGEIADDIFTFLLGEPVFKKLITPTRNIIFSTALDK